MFGFAAVVFDSLLKRLERVDRLLNYFYYRNSPYIFCSRFCLSLIHIFRPELIAEPVPSQLFRRLPVLLIHGKEEKGHHQADHKEHRRRIADGAAGKELSLIHI